jgi:predicted membrane protein
MRDTIDILDIVYHLMLKYYICYNAVLLESFTMECVWVVWNRAGHAHCRMQQFLNFAVRTQRR